MPSIEIFLRNALIFFGPQFTYGRAAQWAEEIAAHPHKTEEERQWFLHIAAVLRKEWGP